MALRREIMLTIGTPKILKQNKKVRLQCEIEINNEIKTLWMEVDEKYSKYLVKDRCDAFLIALLPIALRQILICQWISPWTKESCIEPDITVISCQICTEYGIVYNRQQDRIIKRSTFSARN